MDRDVVMHQMTERFQELLAKALDAVERAPDGQWIAASEGVFLDVCHQLTKESLEAALQARIDAHPTAKAATFSPSEAGDRGTAGPAPQGHGNGSGLKPGR
jgi:hypothetical protein